MRGSLKIPFKLQTSTSPTTFLLPWVHTPCSVCNKMCETGSQSHFQVLFVVVVIVVSNSEAIIAIPLWASNPFSPFVLRLNPDGLIFKECLNCQSVEFLVKICSLPESGNPVLLLSCWLFVLDEDAVWSVFTWKVWKIPECHRLFALFLLWQQQKLESTWNVNPHSKVLKKNFVGDGGGRCWRQKGTHRFYKEGSKKNLELW